MVLKVVQERVQEEESGLWKRSTLPSVLPPYPAYVHHPGYPTVHHRHSTVVYMQHAVRSRAREDSLGSGRSYSLGEPLLRDFPAQSGHASSEVLSGLRRSLTVKNG